MKAYFRLGSVRVFRAPVFVHWSAWVVVLCVLAFGIRELPFALVMAVSYFGLIFLHEFGHAFVANRLGYEVHSIRMTAVHGVCDFEAPDSRRDDATIAWGGICAQAIVAVPLIFVSVVLGNENLGVLRPMIVVLGYFSVLIGIVNLAPSQQLDGGKAWALVPILYREYFAARAKKESRKLKVVK